MTNNFCSKLLIKSVCYINLQETNGNIQPLRLFGKDARSRLHLFEMHSPEWHENELLFATPKASP